MRQKQTTDLQESITVAIARVVRRCTDACVADTNVMGITLVMAWVMVVTGMMRMRGKRAFRGFGRGVNLFVKMSQIERNWEYKTCQCGDKS